MYHVGFSTRLKKKGKLKYWSWHNDIESKILLHANDTRSNTPSFFVLDIQETNVRVSWFNMCITAIKS